MVKRISLMILLGISSVSWASQQMERASFKQIDREIREVVAKFGNENVLTVFDTDDTLLVLNQSIGGEAWYEWQAGEPQCEEYCTPKMKEPAGKNSVSRDLPDLLDKVGELLYLSHSHPNETEIPDTLKRLQSDGIRGLVLTSRGYTNRDATLRHYRENGITFSSIGLKPNQEGAVYLPQVSQAERDAFGLKEVRPVNYTKGIINTEGQHKGVMLLAWMREFKTHPKAIVFVDNESRQTNKVYAVFKDSGIDVTTIRYSHADRSRAAFWSGDKREAISDWENFSAVIENVFGE
jgi:hypothetical protein